MSVATGSEGNMSTIAKPAVHSVASAQLTVLLLITAAAMPFGVEIAGSVWVGGMTHLIPHAWFAHMAYRHTGARQVSRVVRGFYLGQAGKLILTAALVVAATKLPFSVNFLVVFITFIVMVPLYLVLVARLFDRSQ
ncbi:MAG: ATP synthase subunit I [Cellvibrionales bacterium]